MIAALDHWIEGQRARPPAPTRWWMATFLLGLATLAFSLILNDKFPPSGAAIAPGYGAPVIAFEFARNQGDLLAIFGSVDDPLQLARLRAMRAGNEQDYGFMLLYVGFLASGCMALWRDVRTRIALAALALPIFAALCDGYENWLLFNIQTAFTAGGYSPSMTSLPVPVIAKFLFLTATNLAIGTMLMQMPRGWRNLGILIIIPSFAAVMALIAPAAFGWTLTIATGIGWLALLGTAAIGSWFALVRNKPLVPFNPMPVKHHAKGSDAVMPASPNKRSAAFARRGTDDKA